MAKQGKKAAGQGSGKSAGRERAKAIRMEQRRREQRRRLFTYGGVGVVVAALVVGIVVINATSGGGKTSSDQSVEPAPASVLGAVTGVPDATLASIGAGSASAAPKAISNPAPSGGKPSVLYVGAEFCPYCAGERWALIQALSRFGTFSGLNLVHSGDSEAEATLNNLPTFTFRDASYTSTYLSFTPVEESDRSGKALSKPTDEQQSLVSKYDRAPYTTQAGAIPFLWFNDRYVSVGATYDVALVHGLTHQQVADAMADPTSAVAKGIDGTANLFAATLCQLTGQQPSTVCSAAGVKAAAGKLGG